MKIVYNIIKSLRPHFHSLREIGDNVSLDIKIPPTWEYKDLLPKSDDTPFTLMEQDRKEKTVLISLVSPATVEGYDYVFKYAKAVITINKEKEEKARLFNLKVEELKTLFLSSPLDKLKELSFKDLEKNGLSDQSSVGKIELGNEEGPGSD